MENVQGRKEELQGMIDSRQKQLDEGTSLASQNVIYSEIAAFEAEISAIEEHEQNEAAAQVRIQVQEEKVESITLPFDFNDVLSDERYINDQGQPHIITTANDMIVEVVKEFRREANDEHNKEIQALIDAHKEEIRAAGERELQLKRQNDEFNTEWNKLVIENGQVGNKLSEAVKRAEDAESKRAAAVAEKEAAESLLAEKQAHIDTLRDEIAIGASKAINVTNINPSDRLAALVEQSKSAKIKSAKEIALENSAPFRGPVIIGDVVAPPVSVGEATFQPNQASDTDIQLDSGTAEQDAETHQEVADHTFPLSSGDTMENGVTSESGTVVTRQEFEALKADVESLKRRQGLVA